MLNSKRIDEDGRPIQISGPCRIRPIVLLLITRPRDGAVLIQPTRDGPDGPPYWRFPGGGIEFGETIEDAAHREAGEELRTRLAHVQRLRCAEYFFSTPSEPHHELAFICSAIFADPGDYERSDFRWIDGDGKEAAAQWIAQRDIQAAALADPPRLRPCAAAGLVQSAAADPEASREFWAGLRESTPRIRTVARCIIRRPADGAILVIHAFDEVKSEPFFIPPGGGIQFGESSEDAVRREFREEFAADVTNLRHIATIENRFHHRGRPGHEIVLIYEGTLIDESLYPRETIPVIDGGELLVGCWRRLDTFRSTANPLGPPLFPEELVPALLASRQDEIES
jgi:8-oxo-dGTP pyrophosphatase MutT (NUDIX family)